MREDAPTHGPSRCPAKEEPSESSLTCSSPSHQPEVFLLRMRMSWPLSRLSCSGPDEEWARCTWAISAHAKDIETLQTSAQVQEQFSNVNERDQTVYLASSSQLSLMSEKQQQKNTRHYYKLKHGTNFKGEKRITACNKTPSVMTSEFIQNSFPSCAARCQRSYIWLFGFDVVAGEEARAVPYRAVPPLALPLAHKDHVSLSERQISRLGGLVGVQRHVFWST